MSPTSRLMFLLLIVALVATPASAQGPATGTPPFGSFGGGPDVINLANLNDHLTFPVLHKPGRGTNFTYDLSYDSSVWYPVTSGSNLIWQPIGNWGWRGQTDAAVGYVSYRTTVSSCFSHDDNRTEYFNRYYYDYYVDEFGTQHTINALVDDRDVTTTCPPGTHSTQFTLPDGSGLQVTVTADPSATIVKPDGSKVYPPFVIGASAGSVTDRNGNKITVNGSGQFFDTLSGTVPVLTVTGTGTPTSPKTFTYTAPSGANVSYTIHYTAQNVKTYFNCNGVVEYAANSVNLVSDITLPDNSKYQFLYEPTPQNSGYVTGRLASVTLPTGGTITYAYSGGGTGVNGISCVDGSASTLTRTTPDGTWTYAQVKGTGAASTTTITDPTTPTANQTVIQFQGIYETQRDVYQGSTSGTLLATTNTCYNGSNSPCNGSAVALPILQRTAITSLPVPGSSTLQSKSVTLYNSAGMPNEIDAYAFGSGAPPTSPTRKTLVTYAPLGNITAFRQTVTVQNIAGNTVAQTNYNYDQTTPVAPPTGTPPQWTSVSTSRGNLTSVQKCTVLSNCSSYLQTTMTYDTAGQLQTVKDPLNNQTSFGYADAFLDDDGSNPPSHTHTSSAPTDAFATTITPPLNGAITSKYYYYSGQLALSTDQNNNTSYSHFQDLFARLTSAYGPVAPNGNRPWTLNVFAGSHTQADTYLGITDTTASPSCTYCRHDEVALDGLGRTIHGYLVNDPEGQTSVDTAYDALGRVLNTSHPHRSGASTTDGIETPTYDALGRTIKVTHQDATYSQTMYGAAVSGTGVNTTQLCSSSTYGLGFPDLAIDEAGKKREFWTDGLGRTIEADEPDSSGNLTSNTCYSYDPLGNLLQIVHGSQTRTYAYDPLSRVTSVTIPELSNSSGTNCAVTYSYDSNSNVQTQTAPAPNQTTCTSTVTITFSHDALNRLTGKTYSDGSPSVKFGYDGVALTGCSTTPPTLTDSNPKGRKTSMCDASGATSWAHDATGKILTEKRTILGITQTNSYTYNLDGSIATVAYPSAKVVTYTVSNAQRLTAAKDVANNVQFATAASYVPPGGLSGVITGQISGGFGGITESHTYNTSLEYTTTRALPPSGPAAVDLTLNYNLTGGDNGTLTGITNYVDSGRTQSFTYDPLNRILSARSSATSGADCWGQNFGPDGNAADDAVANMTKINSGTQAPPPCPFGLLSATVDGNNHINTDSTYAYDAAGNMTKDGTGTGYSYSFDDENHLTIATGFTGGPYCYVYDGNGLRVAKKSNSNSTCSTGTVTKLYWRSIAGDALAETDSTGSTTNAAYNEYVLFGGRRIAQRTGLGAIFYYFADQVGSTRTITTGSGTGQTPGQLCYDADFTPYGQEISYPGRLQTTACPPNYRFTGYEYDSETGLHYAFARYYSPRLGRFLSTDPLGGSIGDLQSHNAYAYVENNPLLWTDPSGLDPCPNDQSWGSQLCKQAYALGGMSHFNTWNQFDALQAAFTPTGSVPNPAWWTTGCLEAFDCGNIPAFLPVYGNVGILSLSGQNNYSGNSSGSCPPPLVCTGGNSSGSGTVRATPKLKFKPPSWQNFTHEFLPCYGAQLLDNFVGSDDKAGITAGTVALAVAKPKFGGPLLLLWAGINGPKAGAACAFASRAVYE